MHLAPISAADGTEFGERFVAIVAAEGAGTHAWLHAAPLNAGPLASRNIADLIQLLSLLHGTAPGLLEIVSGQNVLREADPWFGEALGGFAAERAYLSRLAVAAGPPPGTPGESATTAALIVQRGALDMIARSDRVGCALGAATALTLDWMAIRAALDTAAARLGITAPPFGLPDEETVVQLIAALPPRERLDRTLAFGARQLLGHHHGLLDLAEARASARDG